MKLINNYSNSKKTLLDIGCGTGDFLQTAQKDNWIISGIEPNPEARKIANQKTNQSIYNTNALQNFKSDSFDVITLWHVLEHLPDLQEQITLYKSLLKASGTLLIAVPNFKSYDAEYYQNFWAAYDVPKTPLALFRKWYEAANGKARFQNCRNQTYDF